MDTKDVDNILDIPNIENWLDVIFTLACYDAGDRILYYNATVDNVTCDVNISLDKDQTLISGESKLSDLIMLDDIGMFELKTGIQTKEWDNEVGFWSGEWIDIFQQHWFRPFLEKSKREY